MNPPTDSCNKSTYLGMILYPSIPRKRNLSVCWHEKEEKWATLKLKWFDVEMQRHAAKQSEVSPPAVLWTYRTEKPQQAQFLIYKMMLCTDLTYITELLWTTLRSDKEWGIIYLHHGRKSQRLSELKRRFQQHLYRNDPLNHDNLETEPFEKYFIPKEKQLHAVYKKLSARLDDCLLESLSSDREWLGLDVSVCIKTHQTPGCCVETDKRELWAVRTRRLQHKKLIVCLVSRRSTYAAVSLFVECR